MRSLFCFTAVALLAAALNAQTPAAPAAKPGGAAATAEQPPAPEPYSYQPEGRRDPFLSLTGTGSDPHAAAVKGEGTAGMSIAEVAVRGVMQSRGTLVAMVSGPDHRTYIVHAGDKLRDGTIKSITAEGMIFIEDVNDPLSLVKRREVSKLLHAEGKE
jgi:Tfp pilus assembly protein PilP